MKVIHKIGEDTYGIFDSVKDLMIYNFLTFI